jgi:hypothetical protein
LPAGCWVDWRVAGVLIRLNMMAQTIQNTPFVADVLPLDPMVF